MKNKNQLNGCQTSQINREKQKQAPGETVRSATAAAFKLEMSFKCLQTSPKTGAAVDSVTFISNFLSTGKVHDTQIQGAAVG